jgi:hypothetical protein
MKYNKEVKSKLEKTRKESEDIEEMWERQRNAYVKSAEEVLGFRKGKASGGSVTTSGNSSLRGKTKRRRLIPRVQRE